MCICCQQTAAHSLCHQSVHTSDGKHAQQQLQVGVSIWQISVKLNETLCQLIECNGIPEQWVRLKVERKTEMEIESKSETLTVVGRISWLNKGRRLQLTKQLILLITHALTPATGAGLGMGQLLAIFFNKSQNLINIYMNTWEILLLKRDSNSARSRERERDIFNLRPIVAVAFVVVVVIFRLSCLHMVRAQTQPTPDNASRHILQMRLLTTHTRLWHAC